MGYNPQYFGGYNAQIPTKYRYNPNQPFCRMHNQLQYQGQIIPSPYQPFHNLPQAKNPQWTHPPQGWKAQNFQQKTLIPSPPSHPNRTTHNSSPPKQPQLVTQFVPNPNNK